MIYTDKALWKAAVYKKYNFLTLRKSASNIMFYSDGKLVATFSLTRNTGVIL